MSTIDTVPDAEPGYGWRTYVYVGRRPGKDVKTVHAYAEVGGEPDSMLAFRKALVPGARIGNLLLIHTNGDRLTTAGRLAPVVGSWDTDTDHPRPADEALARWTAKDTAHGVELEAERRQTRLIRADARDPLAEHIGALRMAMTGMNYRQRSAFVGYVIDRLYQ